MKRKVAVEVKEGAEKREVEICEGDSILGRSDPIFEIESPHLAPTHAVFSRDGESLFLRICSQCIVLIRDEDSEVLKEGKEKRLVNGDLLKFGEDNPLLLLVKVPVSGKSPRPKKEMEKVMFWSKGAAYQFKNEKWKVIPDGYPVNIYVLQLGLSRSRIVALNSDGSKGVINSPIYQKLILNRLQPHFVQWNSGSSILGLSFNEVENATEFCGVVCSVYQGPEVTISFSEGKPDGTEKRTRVKQALANWAGENEKEDKVNQALSAWAGGDLEKKKDSKQSKERPKSRRFGGLFASKKTDGEDGQAQTVDEKTMKTMREIESKVQTLRDKKAHEIYLSEVMYVASIRDVVETCLPTAREMQLPDEDIKSLFCNIELLYNLNKSFLEKLEKRLLVEWKQGEELLIGDVMSEMSPFFKMYEEYYKNYQAVPAKLQKMEKSRKAKAFLHHKVVVEKTQGHGLPNLLIQPCQRLVRYVLLIAELLKETPKTHPDYENLTKSLTTVQNSVSQMNESVRIAEGQKIIANILKHPKDFLGFDVIIEPHRKLMCDIKVTSHVGEIIYSHVYIFNDLAVFCSPETNSKSKIRVTLQVPLKYLWYDALVEFEENEDRFQLVTPFDIFICQALPNTKDDFLVALDDLLRKETVSLLSKDGFRMLDYEWSNGDSYKGEWNSGHPHGEGEKHMKGGNFYSGRFKDGRYSGDGIMKYFSGDHQYDGRWRDNRPHGHGILISLGIRYEGDWKAGRKEGSGKIVFGNGDYFEGEWENDYIQGRGTFVSVTQGVKYEGEWRRCMLHGHGTLEGHDGVYDGSWEDGKREGPGKIEYYNGDVYDGHWKANLRAGSGEMISRDKRVKYNGQWAAGKYQGAGRLWIENDFTYTGHFQEGKFNSSGILERADGTKYRGMWSDGKKDGEGILHRPIGSVYEGSFHNDSRFGDGKLTITFVSQTKPKKKEEPVPEEEPVLQKEEGPQMWVIPLFAENYQSWEDEQQQQDEALFQKAKREKFGMLMDHKEEFVIGRENRQLHFTSNKVNRKAVSLSCLIDEDGITQYRLTSFANCHLVTPSRDTEQQEDILAIKKDDVLTLSHGQRVRVAKYFDLELHIIRPNEKKEREEREEGGEREGGEREGEKRGEEREGEEKPKLMGYSGEWIKDQPEGKGICRLPNGSSYSGAWVSGKRHGKGVFQLKGGLKYTGDWQRNLRHGFGTDESDMGYYEGNFKDDMRSGQGTYTSKKGGFKFEGTWDNDLIHGEGTFTFTNWETTQKVEYEKGSLKSNSYRVFPPPLPPPKSIFRQ